MGAREQLNLIYLTGAAIVAGFAALMFKSLVVFIICLGGLVAILLDDGLFRPSPTRRR